MLVFKIYAVGSLFYSLTSKMIQICDSVEMPQKQLKYHIYPKYLASLTHKIWCVFHYLLMYLKYGG